METFPIYRFTVEKTIARDLYNSGIIPDYDSLPAWRYSILYFKPTILRIDGFRFFLYSGDRPEPIHVHVEKGSATAKIWLDPVRLQDSHGFSNAEINMIIKHVEANNELIVRSWNEFFKD